MNEKIDKLLDDIIERISDALPKTTTISKVSELADILVRIKLSYKDTEMKTLIAEMSKFKKNDDYIDVTKDEI